jgi:hypothetical protein
MKNQVRVVAGNPGHYITIGAAKTPGWEIVGEVTHNGKTGALMRNKSTGIFCRVNAWTFSSLPQQDVIIPPG